MEEQKPVESNENTEGVVGDKVAVEQVPVKSSKKLAIVFGVVLVLIATVAVFFFTKSDTKDDTNSAKSPITSFAECVAAGNPTMESNPEQCRANGETFINKEAVAEEVPTDETDAVADETGDAAACPEGQTQFADEDFGAKFCYPEEWGTASVMDAKIDVADTGHREAVRFSANTKFIVGGTSDDWSTTVGRGVGCQEPNNNVPELSSYDTAWHDLIGSGMDVEFATRSLESSEGGYDMTETVSNIMDSGVCVQGHKVIDGSRYRVLFAAYYTDFADGILSPKAHIDNPTVIFSTEERAQFDDVLNSAEAF